MKEKIKVYTGMVCLGTISNMGLIISLIPQITLSSETRKFFIGIVWVYLLFAFIFWLDMYCEPANKTKRSGIFYLSLYIQLAIFLCMNISKLYFKESRLVSVSGSILIIFLICIELIIRIKLFNSMTKPKKPDYNLDYENLISYIRDSFWNIVHFNKVKIKTDMYDTTRYKILYYNAMSFFVALLGYGLKYIVDIMNFDVTEYSVSNTIIILYVIFLVVFFVLQIRKSMLVYKSIDKMFFSTIPCAIGVYLLVFKHPGYINLQILLCVAYLISPFLIECYEIMQKCKNEDENLNNDK